MNDQVNGVKAAIRIGLWIVVAVIALLIILNTPSCKSTPPPPLPAGIEVIHLQGNRSAFAQLQPGVTYYLETKGYKGNINVTVPVTLVASNDRMQPLSNPVMLSPTDFRVQLDDHKHFGFWPRWIKVTTTVSGGTLSFYR